MSGCRSRPAAASARRSTTSLSKAWPSAPPRQNKKQGRAMDIHEYQAKEILAGYGVPVPRGGLAYSPEQAAYRAREIGGNKWVVKAQVHTGGRGKAGGVKLCGNEHEVYDAADEMFGKRLVTHHSRPEGKSIYRFFFEGAVNILKEIYLGCVLDRKTERVM